MTNTIKMTERMALAEIKNILEISDVANKVELIAYVEKRSAQVEAKSSKASSKRTEGQTVENDFILSILTDRGQLVSEIIKSNGLDVAEWSSSKVTAVLSRLCKLGLAKNYKEGKKSYYCLMQ